MTKSKNTPPLSQTKMADLPGTTPLSMMAEDKLQIGASLSNGRYEIKEQIGEGGMGVVFRAHDTNREEDIAIKVLLPALLSNERAKERFLNEAKLSSQLSHPNIINVYDVQQDGEFYFLTMELLEGQDLRQVMDNRKLARQPFAIDEVQEIISSISEGLAYAHQHTVHRDIKPENIWLTDDGDYKLMDFGIAQVQSTSQRTQTGAAMGTAYYMAPEQLKGAKDVDGRADQYALAVLAYELLSGEVPAGVIESVNAHRKDVPKALSQTILQALSARPEQRFTDITAFAEAFNKKGANIPSLPFKNIGIAAAVLLSIGLIGTLVSNGSLDSLLPESEEIVQARKTTIYKLQGEIKSLKGRLESTRRDLKDKLSEAKRDKNTKQHRYIEKWLKLTTRHVFDSPRITELQGTEAVAEGMLRDKNFEVALTEFTKAKEGYQFLLDTFDVSESTLILSKIYLPQSKRSWLSLKNKYDLTNPKEVLQAEQARTDAIKAYREGELIKAKAYYQNFGQLYEQATTTDVTLEQIQITKDHWAKQALDRKRARAIAKTIASKKERARAKAEAKERAVSNAKAEKAAKLRAIAQAKADKEAEEKAKIKAEADAALELDKINGKMVRVPAGSFEMGSTGDGQLVHTVHIKAFSIGKFEVTKRQWISVMGSIPSTAKSMISKLYCQDCPLKHVGWDDVEDFIERINEQTGKQFRLPTEAEWEYACRSGGKNEVYCGGDNADSVAWYSSSSDSLPFANPIGEKTPNGLGLYDMSGNAAEWTQDCWNQTYKGAPTNGKAWLSGDCDYRVNRGGFAHSETRDIRSTRREGWPDDYGSYGVCCGFRLAHD